MVEIWKIKKTVYIDSIVTERCPLFDTLCIVIPAPPKN